MASKQTILEGRYAHRVNLVDDVNALASLTNSQAYSILLCVTDLLPAQIKIEQRSAKGPIDLSVNNFRFKINQRAKVSQRYEVLP